MMSSTSTCPTCGHRPNAAYQLYAELSNEKQTWVDSVFWTVIGALAGTLIQLAIEGFLA
jgi:hypothetical protein